VWKNQAGEDLQVSLEKVTAIFETREEQRQIYLFL
jgi:hypothetical protein